jgi:hypothetical protein
MWQKLIRVSCHNLVAERSLILSGERERVRVREIITSSLSSSWHNTVPAASDKKRKNFFFASAAALGRSECQLKDVVS